MKIAYDNEGNVIASGESVDPELRRFLEFQDGPQTVDFRLVEDEPPSTLERRRGYLAQLERTVNRPKERNFEDYLRQGPDALTDETRAQGTGTGAAGGVLTPDSFSDRLEIALQQSDEIFAAATLVPTQRGTVFNYPILDDVAASATKIAENAQSVLTAPAVFGNTQFPRCPTWRSGRIVASMELVADTHFPLARVLADAFGYRFSRGVGVQAITDLLTDTDVGATTAAAGAIVGGEILDLIASLNSIFARNGGFLLNWATWTAIQKANLAASGYAWWGKDSTGRNLLFGYPVYAAPSLASLGSNAKPILFGQLDKVVRRQVPGTLEVRVFHELYATGGQIGYEAFLRTDVKLLKPTAGPLPIRALQCHS
jgi:HK97 family phage major capsid protein